VDKTRYKKIFPNLRKLSRKRQKRAMRDVIVRYRKNTDMMNDVKNRMRAAYCNELGHKRGVICQQSIRHLGKADVLNVRSAFANPFGAPTSLRAAPVANLVPAGEPRVLGVGQTLGDDALQVCIDSDQSFAGNVRSQAISASRSVSVI
jgi:hypothetical protein